MNKNLKIALIILISIISYLLPLNIPQQAHITLSILILAILLWITEIIPLFITSIIVMLLLVLFKVFEIKEAMVKFADPILILFFAGFLIAAVMQKYGLDKRIAWSMVSKISKTKLALLVLMFTAAFISLWISNTATTLIMIPIALALASKMKKSNSFSKALVLGIAFSATIGGMGTIIATPPNAIATTYLVQETGTKISFFSWMLHALPLVIILIPLAWLILIKFFPPDTTKMPKLEKKFPKITIKEKIFIAIFAITALLWLTTGIHHISDSVIALIATAAMFIFGLLKENDLDRIEWNILILFGGSLVLGAAIFTTGLAKYFADLLSSVLVGLPMIIIIISLIIFSILLGTIASNTATASIVIPIILPLSSAINISPLTLATLCALAVSIDFMLPVGTPPNAIALATKKIKTRDMVKAGLTLTVVGIIVLTLVATYLWPLIP